MDVEVEWFVAYDLEGKFGIDDIIGRCQELGLLYPEDKYVWVWEDNDLDSLREAVRSKVFFNLA